MKETVPFEFSGYHFKPYLTLHGKDAILDEVASNLSSDLEINLRSWSYDDFFKKSSVTYCDIFLCLENGSLYVPARNKLLRYTGTPEDIKTALKNSPSPTRMHRDYER